MRQLLPEELDRLSPEAYRQAPKLPVSWVLHNLRSGLNVGSVFRTADAFRLGGLYLSGYTAAPPHREISKTALGAEQHVPWRPQPDGPGLLAELRSQGVQVLALEHTETSTSLDLWRPEVGQVYAFVLGNEARGVETDMLAACSHALHIPQWGAKHSLNVSVAAGVLGYVCAQRFSAILNKS